LGASRKGRRGKHHSAPKGKPSFRFEQEALSLGALRIAGIDEAGRGPLAGPVVAAAVVLPLDDPIEGLNDSKLLTPRQRERVFLAVKAHARAVQVAIVPPETIDRINIYQATRAAMAEAVQAVSPSPDYLLIDGTIRLDLNIPQRAIVKGDRLSVSVAAAGVVAKVTRDALMMELHEQFPEYGFNAHKGYATKAHKEAIRRYGPCPAHRRCFRGVKEHLLPPLFNG